MAKRSASTAVPRLRFPEFRGDKEWKLRKLSYLLVEQKRRNKDLKFGSHEVLSVSGEHGCVNQIKLLGRSYAGASVENYHVVETGDIVYTKSPLKKNPFGIIKENKGEPGIVSTLYAVYRATDCGYPTFLDHYFSGDYNLNSYLQPIVRKGAKNDMKVNNAAVLGGEIFAPEVEEQRKVADCLTSLDEVIAAQGRKVEVLKVHKRGLMQQLFPREGESRPRLRFPEFRDAPEWEEATIGSRSKSFSGGTPSTTDDSYYGGAIPFIRSAEIGRATTELFLTEHGLRNSAAKLVEQGDVLVALYGANSGDVALAKTFGAINQAILCIRPEGSKAYLYHFLAAKKAWIIATFIQGGQGNLSGEIVKSVVLQFPSIEEQQRIADCLSSLDTQITAESNQLVTLKVHKQGLMQQLFPAPEAASA